MYTVQFKDEEKAFEDRENAIEAAKEMTDHSRAKAEISDEDGVESLVYEDGEMIFYEYDTRRLQKIKREARNN